MSHQQNGNPSISDKHTSALERALKLADKHQIQAAFLIEATKAVLEYTDFESAAKIIFYACSKQIGATSGYVALLNPNGKENDVLYLEPGSDICTVDPELPMPIRGLREIAYNEKRPVYDNNFLKSGFYKYMPDGHVPLHNVLFAPLIIDDKAIGLIGLGNKPGGFTDLDLTIAAAFGDLAAIALRNNRMFDLLKQNEKELETLNQQKSLFLSILSHDVRSKFHHAKSVIQILNQKYDSFSDDKRKNYLADLEQSISETNTLFENMLLWSKVQMNKVQTHKIPLDISLITAAIAASYKTNAAAKNIKLSTDIERNLKISADDYQLNVIIRNLLSNALKFTQPGGTVTITLKKEDEKVHLSVKDSGIGMSGEVIDKILNKDIMKGSTGTQGEEGSGLGMQLVKSCTNKHDGELIIESEPGKGSTFSLFFPLFSK
jgi:signal transduction histidine kinase